MFTVFSISSFSQDISGNWIGEINRSGKTLEFAFNLKNDEAGLKATMDIPKQGLSNSKAETAKYIDSTLTITFPDFNMEYIGRLNQQNEFIGNLSQGGQLVPMNLTKGKIKLNRPQEPKPPFDYYSENVIFENTADKIKLSGTLTLPKKEGKFPVVIIISGSGPQNRDGEMFGHKPYLVLADHLTKNGIGVLRYDERGVGESQGDMETAAINEFSSDVKSAIDYLKTRKEIDPLKIGLIGHSIGGIIAPKIAVENGNINFIVLMAAPGINGDKLMLSQKAAYERLLGYNEMQIAQSGDVVKGAYNVIVNSDLDNPSLKDSLNSFYIQKYGPMLPEDQREALVDQITDYEVVSLIKSEPSIYLEKIKCPVLAINGSKDFQVLPKENLPAIKSSIEKNGNKNVKIVELENLNHLFQESETGTLSEYSEIEQTMSPVALELIAEWIKDLTTVSMSAEPNMFKLSLVPGTVEVKVRNKTNDTITTGLYYHIEHFKNNQWLKVSPDQTTPDIAYLVGRGDFKAFDVRLLIDQIEYEVGKYRIVKDYFKDDYKEKFHVFAEFSIE